MDRLMGVERLIITALGVFVCLASSGASMANAHGGRQVFADDVGPYFVQAFVEELAAERGGYADYTISLRTADSRIPVDDATITVAAETPDGRIEPRQAKASDNLHEVLLPFRNSGDWTVEVSIEGPLGPATFHHSMTARVTTFSAGPEGPDANWRILYLAAPTLGAMVVIIAWRRLRRVSA